MDEKTVIARPKSSEPEQPKVQPRNPDPTEVAATVIVQPKKGGEAKPKTPSKEARAGLAKPARQSRAKPGEALAKPDLSPRKPSPIPIVALLGMAVLFVGLGSALTTIYVLTPSKQAAETFTEHELSQDIVAVQTEESEAEDERLVREAIQPRIIELSGDPVIVRQLTNAPRQLIKLSQPPQIKAAADLGIQTDIFRLKDVLDQPSAGLQPGVLGSQDDIAVMQPAAASGGSENSGDQIGKAAETSSIIVADGGGGRIAEFAEEIKAGSKLSSRLTAFGLDAARSQQAGDSFASLYDQAVLRPGDRLAVRAVAEDSDRDKLMPVQISVYRGDALLGSIALNDIETFSKSEDPWYQRDIFESPLLPEDIKPEDRPRLLDAVYSVALRNGIPAAVVGEAIMLLSRAQDLEQKVQAGDTVTLVYSPAARDAKTGFGRVVFISIGRTTGNLDCYALQAQSGAQFECVSLAGESSVQAGGMTMPVNGVIVSRFGPQGDKGDAKDQMNFGVDWTAPEGTPVVAAFAGDVTAAGPESGLGTVVRLSHADQRATMYAYLLRVPSGIAIGASKRRTGHRFCGNPAHLTRATAAF
jgi:murein DD-endopeptidase MepM/ murein hydrolase activator NlpD